LAETSHRTTDRKNIISHRYCQILTITAYRLAGRPNKPNITYCYNAAYSPSLCRLFWCNTTQPGYALSM